MAVLLTFAFNSASVATLIRVKFLVDLTDTDDILCKKTHSQTPARLLLVSDMHVSPARPCVTTYISDPVLRDPLI